MKSIKILLSLLLCFGLIFGLVACTQPAGNESESNDSDSIYKAGTYTSTATGNNGDISVEVVFDNTSIKSVKVLEHSETAGLSDAPIERIPQEVVEGQTLVVDAVTGATNTSNAILVAIEDCVNQAGGNVEALKAKASSDEADKTVTELNTDVVIVGAGGTGLAAAYSAHENNANVIVLEKLASIGGSTGLSGGGISANDTRFQREEGIEDSKESWMDLWKERQATSNPDSIYPDYDFVDKFMDEAVITTEWLVDNVGHEYGSVEGFGLDPVRRIHFPKRDGDVQGGSLLIQNIEKSVLGEGIEILTETPATELLTNEDGDVVGVVAEGKDGKLIINAEKVILAAGGYAKNDELLERFIPELAGSAELSAATPGSTGDGILMAEKVGAALYEDPWVIGLGVASKINGTSSLGMDWTKMYVNGDGERFANEQMHYAIATNKIVEQDITWAILDSNDVNVSLIESLEAAMPTEEAVKADTFEALAEAMGVNVDTFVENMNSYNEGTKTDNDEMGKEKEYLVAVEKAPYYAVKLYPKTMGTFAGVKTDENFQVLREDNSVIKNLYAGGECANKVMYNQVYMSGSAVQFALTSGRIAGEHAAQNLK
ncbi:FAD-dependent oxidoreductase [Sedimentibacter sp. MB31-C6]|uniref:FAD-dependent oxidoreductase n=1 Tax=Sedimentibacter sp. MB31-C6 TaxID=3109366 RepID=UPI002DDD1983|nr:FAD-dependent oxidoreductase [Sedimentibacter sp. MB36-C1]WSI03268.1 FAD-dependent oxidoreductase [Sedimentibacter sp. MB36-C1]